MHFHVKFLLDESSSPMTMMTQQLTQYKDFSPWMKILPSKRISCGVNRLLVTVQSSTKHVRTQQILILSYDFTLVEYLPSNRRFHLFDSQIFILIVNIYHNIHTPRLDCQWLNWTIVSDQEIITFSIISTSFRLVCHDLGGMDGAGPGAGDPHRGDKKSIINYKRSTEIYYQLTGVRINIIN